MMRVMKKHRAAADQISKACPEYMLEAAKESLDRAVKQQERGYRNAQATVLLLQELSDYSWIAIQLVSSRILLS